MIQIIKRIKTRKSGKNAIILFLSLSLSCYTYSQEINTKALFNATKETAGTENKNADKDNSTTMEIIQKALYDTSGIILFDEEELPPTDMPDSVYIRRLTSMPSVISLPYNNIVRNYIVYYIQKYPRYSEKMLGLAEYYLPVFEEILDTYNIPLEMKALPIIESALNPVAVSRVGATGMWQFMLTTGRRHGLTINTYVDERRDPIASTHAAAKYLTALYAMFQDWTLALAAYNCGEGNVLKAIARAGNKKDYWEIYPYLPKETRNYVPLFIAANYTITYYKEHRLTPNQVNIPTYADTFMVNSKLHFEQIANIINIPVAKLREMNPQYRRDVIPGNERSYELRIPTEYTNIFIEKEKEIYGYNEKKYFNTDIVVNPATISKNDKNDKSNKSNKSNKDIATSPVKTSDSQPITHLVKSGESLGRIASKYKVKLSKICEWNNLKEKSTIYPGQKLVIYDTTTSKQNEIK
ncbi:MAG: transglycosylase SLT domain-containing protein [Prevotellaceae bacterium]|jgi:membrane-bound lytic murein transglycosylase D|nr:transglycosylase SLT domain-containing protein [Prevotellaceae bacterium]